MMRLKCAYCYVFLFFVGLCPAFADYPVDPESPVKWVKPDTFDCRKPDMGLPVLKCASHSFLFDPQEDEGVNGQYKSTHHGTYSHHSWITLYKNYFIVTWTNHLQDENGPGQRILAKLGVVSDDKSDVIWGGDETVFEVCPPPHPAKRRREVDDNDIIDSIYVNGGFSVINGRLFMEASLGFCDGWTDSVPVRVGNLNNYVPSEHYGTKCDTKTGWNWDIFWKLDTTYVQEWSVTDGVLRPITPLYRKGANVPNEIRITEKLTKKILPLNSYYNDAIPFEQSPEDFQAALKGQRDWPPARSILMEPGKERYAANGSNGLAHKTQYIRRDGVAVMIADNLMDDGSKAVPYGSTATYYASIRQPSESYFKAPWKTNLFGAAQAVSGELPDGSNWLVGSNLERTKLYLATSPDGITFDRTWSLITMNKKGQPGVCKGGNGPQYPVAVTIGDNIWIVYSVYKQWIGVTKIPVKPLLRTNDVDKDK